ncbi:unnamed protein product [Larinioides sclopetarius]|uniref:Uncharacterized protein n=1 Tax=Larinioides sclopetarius TaxID=280406 RepID=A0AAV2BF68_9ARAC
MKKVFMLTGPFIQLIRVLGKADDYEEGQRKVKRSLKSSDLKVSTDLEKRRPKNRVVDCESSDIYNFPETPSKRTISKPQLQKQATET